MQRTIIDFGTLDLDVFGWSIPLRIYGYGLMLVLGFLVSLAVAQWRARRAGEDPEHMARVALLALVGGIVGSRVAYIIERWESHFARAEDRFAEMLDVSSGGLIYYGGVLLATAMVVAYLLRKRLPVRRYLDIVAAPLMIGLAFGRAGCTLNGCCYGARCGEHWPLGMRFPMPCPGSTGSWPRDTSTGAWRATRRPSGPTRTAATFARPSMRWPAPTACWTRRSSSAGGGVGAACSAAASSGRRRSLSPPA